MLRPISAIIDVEMRHRMMKLMAYTPRQSANELLDIESQLTHADPRCKRNEMPTHLRFFLTEVEWLVLVIRATLSNSELEVDSTEGTM